MLWVGVLRVSLLGLWVNLPLVSLLLVSLLLVSPWQMYLLWMSLIRLWIGWLDVSPLCVLHRLRINRRWLMYV